MVKIKLVVLDCDGVILESVAVKTEAFGKLFLEFGEEACQQMIQFHLQHGGVSRFEKFAWFYRQVLGREITGPEKEVLNQNFTALCLQGVINAPFVPGALEFISSWHKRLPLYVASGTPEIELKEIFQLRELNRYFQGIHGAPPDKTALLENIVRAANVDPAQTLMVGDSSTDLEAAEAVGTLFYGRGEKFAESCFPWGENMQDLSRFILESG